MSARRMLFAVSVVVTLSSCTTQNVAVSPSASPTTSPPASASPSPDATLSPEVAAACRQVERATRAEVRHDWKGVTSALYDAWRAGHGASDRQFARLLPPQGAFFPGDTQTIGETTATLATACGLPPEPILASPAGSPSRRAIELSTTAVAGIRIGTSAVEAERRLRQSLGPPDENVPLPGCEGESGSRLTWNGLSVLLSNGGDGPVLLRGWSLRDVLSKNRYVLPYDVQPGDRVRDAMREVPRAVGVAGEGETDGRYVVHTDKQPGLLWVSNSDGAAGTVDEISFDDSSCD